MKFTFVPEASPLEGYTIKRAIHRGGFGEVYYALSDSGKEVALKLLNNNLEVELRGVTQCLNLKHPNLVTIFDIRQDADGDHWIVMEYIGGRGLYEVMQDHPDGLSIDATLKWLSGISAGLSFLHDRGIVHRDLKPANVFADQDVVKVGDVGLSKYISESRRSAQTQSVGTVYYMAPEVCHGRYGREVDVYAMGVMLVEMLTGYVPFDGETTAEILMKHMTAEPDLSAVPEQVREVIAAALVKDPEQRISDVEELERRFRAAIGRVSEEDLRKSRASTAARPQSSSPLQTTALHGAEAEAVPNGTLLTGRTIAMRLTESWNRLPVPLKWVVGGIAAVLVLETGLPGYIITRGAFLGLAVYVGWRLVSYFTSEGNQSAETSSASDKVAQPASKTARQTAAPAQPPQARPVPPQPAAYPPRRSRYAISYTPATARTIPKRQRLSDLTNSLSISLAATFLVTLAVFLTTNLLQLPVHAVYFGAITMLAAWAVMIPSKLGEGRPSDSLLRRMTHGAIGLGVGLLAFNLQNYLLLLQDPLFYSSDAKGEYWRLGRIPLADGSGFPTGPAFMMFFGVLFAVRRWWWQSDSFRRSRFRVSSTLMTLLVGAVLSGILQFPAALGATWALAISAVVQLSAGWTPQEERILIPKRQENTDAVSQAAEVNSVNKHAPVASV